MSNIYELPFPGKVGHAEDTSVITGTTACVFDNLWQLFTLWGHPGTRETELLNPEYAVAKVDAIVLSGGSAFGLDAAAGVKPSSKKKVGVFLLTPSVFYQSLQQLV